MQNLHDLYAKKTDFLANAVIFYQTNLNKILDK